jgi:hypothetical protein
MGFHQIKKLLYSEGNNYQNQKKTYRIGENPMSVIHQIISRIYKKLQKLNIKK